MSIYQERLLCRLIDELGLRLAQRFAWLNPSKLPAPAEWVTVRRVRVKSTLEQILWLTPSDDPYADNRQVLCPLLPLDAGPPRGWRRTSRHAAEWPHPRRRRLRDGQRGRHTGELPDPAEHQLERPLPRGMPASAPPHPSRASPTGLPEFFVKFLTRPGDLVFDPFGGSSTTGEVAERLDRHWVTSDQVLAYVLGARHRFSHRQLAANPSGS